MKERALLEINPYTLTEDESGEYKARISAPWLETVSCSIKPAVDLDQATASLYNYLINDCKVKSYTYKDFFINGSPDVNILNEAFIEDIDALLAYAESVGCDKSLMGNLEGLKDEGYFVFEHLYLTTDKTLLKNHFLWSGGSFRALKHKENSAIIPASVVEHDGLSLVCGGFSRQVNIESMATKLTTLINGVYKDQMAQEDVLSKPIHLLDVYVYLFESLTEVN